MKKVILLSLCTFLFCGCAQQQTQKAELISPDDIIREELVIEGLNQEYDLLFLTDLHIIVPSQEDSDRVIAYARERLPLFQNKQGVPSAEQFAGWMDFAADGHLDAVLLGGDMIDYPSLSNIEYLQGQLERLEIPYLYAPGNHDWTFPWEYMTDWGREEYLPLLEPLMQGNTSLQSLDMGEFIVVAVNNCSGQVSPEVADGYEELLSRDKPVIVIAHVPFLTQAVLAKAREEWDSPVVIGGGDYGGISPDEVSEAFINKTTEMSSPVAAVLAGHVHFFSKDCLDGEKQVVQFTGDAGYQGKALLLHVTGGAGD